MKKISRYKLFLIIIIIGFSMINCEKTKEHDIINLITYDTIYPLDYFPAWPGSYWVYDNNDTLEIEDDFQMYIYTPEYDGENIDTLILPKISRGGEIYDLFYINGYSFSNQNRNYHEGAFLCFLSIEEGKYWEKSYDGFGNYEIGHTLKTDTNIIINNVEYEEVIIVINYDDHWLSMGFNTDECWHRKNYFAKNIGLIKTEERQLNDSIYDNFDYSEFNLFILKSTFNLIDYEIANKK